MVTYSMPLIALDAVVLDTETTGLDARSARVIQIGALWLTGATVTDGTFETLIDPGIAVPAATTKVHGITQAMLAGRPAFSAAAPDLIEFIGPRIIVGHSIGYDMAVLAQEFTTAGLDMPRWRTLDVRTLARVVAPTLADHSLDRLCDWLDIRIEGRHSAIGDARATAAVYAALLPKLRENNVRTLAEAETASRSVRDAEVATNRRHYDSVAPPPPVFERIDSFAYRTRVADAMTTPPLIVPADMTLAGVLQTLIETGASSVFVRIDDGRDGIVTERDILRAVARDGAAALTATVSAHAQAPLQTVGERDHLYRALGRMSRLDIRHLAVVDDAGQLVGAVTTRNLLKHRAGSATVLGDAIDCAASAGDLAAAWSRLAPMARSLMSDEVDPFEVCAVVSAEISAMTARAAHLAVAAMMAAGRGAPPVDFTVLVLGSAARGESQLAADQDNAIVYASGAEDSEIDRWFAEMAAIMCDTLDHAGIPLCTGGVMARNRAWRKSLADWTETVDGWVRRQRPEDLLNVDIFFDAAPVYGVTPLADTLRDHAYRQAHASRPFQALLTHSAHTPPSPFTLFGGIRTDERGRFDVKRYGLMPLFSAARVLSIRHDVRERSSAARFRGVAKRGLANAETVETIVASQEHLLGAVLGQQLIDIETGVPPSTRIAVERLSRDDKAQLKTACAAADEAADLVSEGRL